MEALVALHDRLVSSTGEAGLVVHSPRPRSRVPLASGASERRPKVLFTMDSLYNGGTEKSLLEIASRFQTIEPVFCCFYSHRQLEDAFHAARIPVHFLGLTEAYGFSRAARFLSGVLDRERPALVVGSLLRSELISRWVCHRRRVPVVGTFVSDTYSPAAYAGQSASRRRKAEFFRVLNRVSARWCVHFISNSAAIGRSNARALGVPEGKISVIPRGRDEKAFAPQERAIASPLRTIVNVGRLRESKGQGELLHAFARISVEFPDAEMRIAGEGPYRAALESEILGSGLAGRVTLLGNVTDVAGVLREADLFAFPSHYEGFSGALVEAMLSALPIVASSIPMNLEAVEEGKTALTFPAGDADAIADRIRWCLSHPEAARQMGRRAREAALARFTLDSVAAQYEELLLRLAAQFGMTAQAPSH